jgi:hypothetical protein
MTDPLPPQETLQDLVLRRLAELGTPEGPLSLRDAADKSRGKISYETLRLIARGRHQGAINDRTAEGLAEAVDVPLALVYRTAGVPRPGARWEWPSRFDRLPGAQRKLVEDVAAGMLEMYDKGRRDASGA